MKRLHVHISVDDIDKNRQFYTTLFGAEPTKVKSDYVQWLLDDPALNFAISTGKIKPGLNHLGIQVESDAALDEIEQRLADMEQASLKQEEAACCYAMSKKYWIEDPQGIIWENYHTMEQIEVFGTDLPENGTGCCEPDFSKNALWSTQKKCC